MEQSNKSPFINAAGQNLLPDTVKEALKGLPYASQDGKYFDAKVVARYFGGNYTAYVLENANSDGEVDGCVFGLVAIDPNEFEYGDIWIPELASVQIPVKNPGFANWVSCIERDTSVPPLKYTLGECFAKFGELSMVPQWMEKKACEDAGLTPEKLWQTIRNSLLKKEEP